MDTKMQRKSKFGMHFMHLIMQPEFKIAPDILVKQQLKEQEKGVNRLKQPMIVA
jgi:hypothetical protein